MSRVAIFSGILLGCALLVHSSVELAAAATPSATVPPEKSVCCQHPSGAVKRVTASEFKMLQEKYGWKQVGDEVCQLALATICCQTHPDGCAFPSERQACLLPEGMGWGGVEAPGPCNIPQGEACCLASGPVPPGEKNPAMADAEACCINGELIVPTSFCAASPTPTPKPLKKTR